MNIPVQKCEHDDLTEISMMNMIVMNVPPIHRPPIDAIGGRRSFIRYRAITIFSTTRSFPAVNSTT